MGSDQRARGVPAWQCTTCGNDLANACTIPTPGCNITPEFVVDRLERAGATLLSMRTRSPYPPPYQCALPDPVRDIYDKWDWIRAPSDTIDTRPPIPNAAAIQSMEATYLWLQMIPDDRFVLRRIVGARSLVHPTRTDRPILSYRKLGGMLRCSYQAVINWHGQGIDLIVDRLRA
jgi:hypothetical protein